MIIHTYKTGSPGSAEHAITVANSTKSDVIHNTSSKGPVPNTLAIKPDVTAPGTDIYSCIPDSNNYAYATGTSMACPHVAGAAALLMELHPEWSMQEIKDVLMNTAVDIGDEVWAQGAGRIDVFKAAQIAFIINPGSIHFGFVDADLPTWQSTQNIKVKNISGISQTINFDLKTTLPGGVTYNLSQDPVNIPAGDSTYIDFTITVDNDVFGYPGGYVPALEGTLLAMSDNDTNSVPFVFFKTENITFAFDSIPDLIYVHNRQDWQDLIYNITNPFILILPDTGYYDFVFCYYEHQKLIYNAFLFKENIYIYGDTVIPVSYSEIENEITYRCVDHIGNDIGTDVLWQNYRFKASDLNFYIWQSRSWWSPIPFYIKNFSNVSDEYNIEALLVSSSSVNDSAIWYTVPLGTNGISSSQVVTNIVDDYIKINYYVSIDETIDTLQETHIYLYSGAGGFLYTDKINYSPYDIRSQYFSKLPFSDYRLLRYKYQQYFKSTDISDRDNLLRVSPKIKTTGNNNELLIYNYEDHSYKTTGGVEKEVNVKFKMSPPSMSHDPLNIFLIKIASSQLEYYKRGCHIFNAFGDINIEEFYFTLTDSENNIIINDTLLNDQYIFGSDIKYYPLITDNYYNFFITYDDYKVDGIDGQMSVKYKFKANNNKCFLYYNDVKILSDGYITDTIQNENDNKIRYRGLSSQIFIKKYGEGEWFELSTEYISPNRIANIPELCEGLYSIKITGVNYYDSDTLEYIVEPAFRVTTVPADPLEASIDGTDVSFPGGSDGAADLTVTGGIPPYSYQWSNGETTEDLINITAGTYEVTVTDVIFCTATASVTISEPPEVIISITSTFETCAGECDGTATANPVGGAPPYTYQWDDPYMQNTQTATNLCNITYNVTVTDNNSITGTASVTIVTDPALFPDPPPTFNVSVNDLWSNDFTVDGIIEIENDVLLTLQNCTLQFGANSGIIVNQGGKLKLDNAHLTGLYACNNLWDGVTVLGDVNASQPANPYDPSVQGFAHMTNGSVIENAYYGFNIGGGGDDFYVSEAGGIVWIDGNSILKNNHRGVFFKYYDIQENESYIKNCTFTEDQSFYNAYYLIGTFVFCIDNEGIDFENVIFETDNTYPTYFHTAIAGVINNSEIKYCTFKDMYIGIRYNLFDMNIHHNTFTNVQRNIESWSGNFLEINNNTFTQIPAGYYVPNVYYDSYGIYLVGPTVIDIRDNTFDGFSSVNPDQAGSYGIIVHNSRNNSGPVFKNDFSGVDFGIQAQGRNDALNIRCNNFAFDGNAHNVAGLAVAKYGGVGTLMDQGIGCARDGDPAGNEWRNDCPSGNETDIFVETDITFDYYSYRESQDYPYTEPHCSSEEWYLNYMLPNICDISKTPFSCDKVISKSNITKGGTRDYVAELKNKIAEHKTAIDSLQAILNNDPQNEQIKREINWHYSQIQLLENEIVWYYKKQGDMDNAIAFLEESESVESKKLLVEIYLDRKEITLCRSVLNNIPKDSLEEQYFCKLMYCLAEIKEQGKNPFLMNASQEQIIREVAESPTKVSVKAESILRMVFNEEFEHPIMKFENGKSRKTDINSNIKEQYFNAKIYPNPTPGNFAMVLLGTNIKYPYSFRVINMIGETIYDIKDVRTNVVMIDISDQSKGIYFVIINIGKETHKEKIIYH